MTPSLFYGTLTPSWFRVRGENWLTGQPVDWPRSLFGKGWLKQCRELGPRHPWAWDGKAPEPADRLTNLSRTSFDDLVRLLNEVFVKDSTPHRWLPALQEIVQSPLIDDEVKAALLVSGNGRALWDDLAPALPAPLHPRLVREFRLEELWTNLDQEVDRPLRRMAEVLAEPEQISVWEDRRREGFSARRAAQERLEQEERSLRAALTQGRKEQDTGMVEVTEEFRHAFRALAKGTPLLFVTGRPGTGKSTFIRALRSEIKGRNFAICAFTGAAALNVGGQTLHSFFQLPPRLLNPESLEPAGFKLKTKLQALDLLIIDEVSLLRPDLADALDERLKTCRADRRPFGGVQVVLVGDLYQLPPVGGRDDEAEAKWLADTYPRSRWFHAARVFDRHLPVKVELTKVFRQTQAEFLSVLGAIREGTLSAAALNGFNAKVVELSDFTSSEFHTRLVPHNKDVTLHNQSRLALLAGTEKTFTAELTGEELRESDSRYPADRHLVLKPKAQVVFLRNDPAGRWSNGDFGIVEDLGTDLITVTTAKGTHRVDRSSWDLGKYDFDPATKHLELIKTGTFRQFPIRLSWALTIHKMQGQTVDRMVLDLGTGAFEPGMTYVALSRCRTLEGIRLSRPLVPADLTVDPTVGVWLDSLKTPV